LVVLLGDDAADFTRVAERFHATAPDRRPLLMYTFLPRMTKLDCVSLGLPRPVPILPLLIRRLGYTHQPGGPKPDLTELLILLAAALQKRITLAGVDINENPPCRPADSS
jgi:hypothetical protein